MSDSSTHTVKRQYVREHYTDTVQLQYVRQQYTQVKLQYVTQLNTHSTTAVCHKAVHTQ
jgi:hypothetical protein